MNEQLQTELTKIITNINNGAETAWGFITEQTPDIVQQLLMWHGVKSFMAFCIGILFIIVGFILTRKLFTYSKSISAKRKEYVKKSDYSYYDPTPYVLMWVVPLCVCIVAIPLTIFENLTWLKIWIAPKVWLLEYVASMVK